MMLHHAHGIAVIAREAGAGIQTNWILGHLPSQTFGQPVKNQPDIFPTKFTGDVAKAAPERCRQQAQREQSRGCRTTAPILRHLAYKIQAITSK